MIQIQNRNHLRECIEQALLNQYWYDGHRLSIPEFSSF